MYKRKSTSNDKSLSSKRPNVPKSCQSGDTAGKNSSFQNTNVIMVESDDEMDGQTLVLPSTSSTHQSNSARTKAESERLKKAGKQSSWIWKHTNLLQNKGQPDRYKCMHCEKTFVRSGTGVISRHSKNKHNEKLRNLDTQSTLTKSGELVLPFKVRYLYLFSLYL
ncbi:hypothetical protein GHT06_017081 [Daphnia sinensis]|uniref:BED-type domain-containing protein n=1 Tax=Daphnia sinensis TaxID=1820382 RepID=A0AAD5L7R1_9CRUS|nr:hypothetical protein GHT06_017081 [Daphnia sinensis]